MLNRWYAAVYQYVFYTLRTFFFIFDLFYPFEHQIEKLLIVHVNFFSPNINALGAPFIILNIFRSVKFFLFDILITPDPTTVQ